MKEVRIIKDDINFMENPSWVVSKRDLDDRLSFKQKDGSYEVTSPEGMPVKIDKVVLYFLMHKLLKENNLTSNEIITTRYEISKNVYSQQKNFSKEKYARILLALDKWKKIYMKFEGTFCSDSEDKVDKEFSVLEDSSLDKKTNQLSIKFNKEYIKQLRETKFYQLINFSEYIELIRPVSVRLYEILLSKERWKISILDLAIKLTLGKKDYPSQILATIKPAIKEINKKTTLQIRLIYNKKKYMCKFIINRDKSVVYNSF